MPSYLEMNADNVSVRVEVDETGTGVVGGGDLRAFLGDIAMVVKEAAAAFSEQKGAKAEIEFGVTASDGGVPAIVLDRAKANFHVRVLVGTTDVEKTLEGVEGAKRIES